MHNMLKFLIFAFLLTPIFSLTVYASEDGNLGAGTGEDVFHMHYPPDPVNLNTLNFYLPSQDLFLPCFGFPMEVRRSYNSHSEFVGPFGIGWTFNYNVRLLERQGYLQIIEEDGYRNEYYPEEMLYKNKTKIIDKIVAAIKTEHKTKEGALRTTTYYDSLKKKLSTDESYYDKLKENYLFTKIKLTHGIYYSTTRGSSEVTKNSTGYVRSRITGKKEYFNTKGQLIKVTDKHSNTEQYVYDGSGLLKNVIDPCNRKLTFIYTDAKNVSDKRVNKVIDPLNRVMTYGYDKKYRLTSYIDTEGKTTTYTYYDDFSKMWKLSMPSDTPGKTDTIEIIYKDKNFGSVSKLKGPGTLETSYEQKTDPNDKSHRYTIVTSSNPENNKRIDYYTNEHKVVETAKDSSKQTTEYSACCGKPVSITDEKGNGEFFKYDANNNLKRRYSSSGQTTEFKYDTRFNQINEIVSSDGTKISYHYNTLGDLDGFTNKEGLNVTISYNSRGSISKIVSSSKIEITFDYNNIGKQKEIAKKGVGKIKMDYDPTGIMTNVATESYNKEKPLTKEELIQDIKFSLMDILKMLRPAGLTLGV